MSQNNLKDIQDDAFMELDSLIHLDLSNNQLLSIELILPSSLKSILIRNNVLASWPIKEINSALSTVDLHNNTLELIHIKGPETIHIEHLIVSENQLESFPRKSFAHLKTLDLSYNKFDATPDQLGAIAPQLEQLDMTGNPLESLNFTSPITIGRLIFKNLPKLTVINELSFENVTGRRVTLESEAYLDLAISHCPLLTTIEDGAFEGLNFYDLDLSNNQITTIPESLTNWTTIPGRLDLQGNPLACDCGAEWMMKDILNKLYEDPKRQYLLEDLRCDSPADRKHMRFVHFYRHVTPFCGTGRPAMYRLQHREKKAKEEEEEAAQMSGFGTGSSIFGSNRRGLSQWLVIGICAITVICLTVVGVYLQLEMNQRRRDSRRRMLFSDL